MLYVLKIHKICFNSKRVTVFLKKTLIIKSTSSKLAKQSKLDKISDYFSKKEPIAVLY